MCPFISVAPNWVTLAANSKHDVIIIQDGESINTVCSIITNISLICDITIYVWDGVWGLTLVKIWYKTYLWSLKNCQDNRYVCASWYRSNDDDHDGRPLLGQSEPCSFVWFFLSTLEIFFFLLPERKRRTDYKLSLDLFKIFISNLEKNIIKKNMYYIRVLLVRSDTGK